MEYRYVSSSQFDLVMEKVTEAGEGWEMQGNPVFDPRFHEEMGAGRWFAVLRRDQEAEKIRQSLKQGMALIEKLNADAAQSKAELEQAMITLHVLAESVEDPGPRGFNPPPEC
jgi:hypothetical protein